MKNQVDEIERAVDVLDAAGIATTDLVVHDLCGMVGLGFAVRHPDRVWRCMTAGREVVALSASDWHRAA